MDKHIKKGFTLTQGYIKNIYPQNIGSNPKNFLIICPC
jgi:hypothetical protein